VAARIRSRTRQAWLAIFEGTDACVTPVLSLEEAPAHPHNRHRGAFAEVAGGAEPAPAPRFSRTPAAAGDATVGAHRPDALVAWGITGAELGRLVADGVVD